MNRLVYCWLLRLHPPHFRKRFEGEMIWIFDEAARDGGCLALTVDAARSLARQWLLRPRPKAAGCTLPLRRSSDGVPLFLSIGDARPHPTILLLGAMLSLASFAGVVKAASYKHVAYRIAGGTQINRQADVAPQGTSRPSFEVASIRLNKANALTFINLQPGGRFVAESATLKTLVRLAYRVEDFQITGGPGWIGVDRYDVEAKTEGVILQDQFPAYLESLLAERFGLEVHREMRNTRVYALVIGKDGHRLQRSTDKNEQPIEEIPAGPLPPPPPPPPPYLAAGVAPPIPEISALALGGIITGQGFVVARGKELENLARILSAASGRPVIDRTGLAGFFDFRLQWAPGPAIAADDPRTSVFTAVQEQLGLKLESQESPVEFIVIDGVARPTEN